MLCHSLNISSKMHLIVDLYDLQILFSFQFKFILHLHSKSKSTSSDHLLRTRTKLLKKVMGRQRRLLPHTRVGKARNMTPMMEMLARQSSSTMRSTNVFS